MFNLITDPWLPVRRLSGPRDHVRVAGITSQFKKNPILALDFPRPDWNAAVTELVIGLLAVVMPPEDTESWAETWANPPSPVELEKRLAPLAFAFNLDGDRQRCFQDLDPLADCEDKPIDALIIDAANVGAKNTDLFVKQSRVLSLALAEAAAALVTMQTYAPAGGQGHRTSMRGGGPLTTIPMLRRDIDGMKNVTTLWDLVWSSVPDAPRRSKLPATPDDPAWALIFPWLAPTRTSESDRSTARDDDAHVLQQFFGLPRRIRLFVEGDVVRTYKQKNFGVKYVGFVHHLSPHRQDKKSGLLPYHPQPGGATYRDWLTWVDKSAGISQRAACLDAWEKRLQAIGDRVADGGASGEMNPWQSSVLAFGYDMDNMKARGWLEARIPFFDVPRWADPNDWPQHFLGTAKKLVAAADQSAKVLRTQVRIALTGKLNRDGRYMADENLPPDAFSDLTERLWRETEADFRRALADLRGRENTPDTPQDLHPNPVRSEFLKALRTKALDIFDEIAGTDDLIDKDARRIVEARTSLLRAFGETGSVREALDIVTEAARQKRNTRKSKKKEPA